MAAEPSDQELLAAHVAGDAEAFGVLFRRHRDRLWAVALRTCGDRETAADGLQDGLVAAFRRADSFRGDAAVTTWLHRVVVNACLDRLRAQRVRRAEPLPDDLDFGDRDDGGVARQVAVPPTAAADPVEHTVMTDRRERVRAALATLPLEQRAAVVLVDMEGYSVAEVAEMLGCAAGTVKSRCSRARARLAGLLGDLLAGEADEEGVPVAGGNRPASADVRPIATRGPPPATAAPTPD
ncbi:RNA polymerase sigma factor SigM [Nocardioides sp. SYSU DS0651]|uniref:RNA polymerase sigma factor SigM n=1 Tax=Nocardioides sp. SYSU DS0651 TaxID=3415955 RepID=UPI003F4C1673